MVLLLSAGASSGRELTSQCTSQIKGAAWARRRDELPLTVAREELWAVRWGSRNRLPYQPGAEPDLQAGQAKLQLFAV